MVRIVKQKLQFILHGMISGSREELYATPMQAMRALIQIRAERQKPEITAIGDDYQVHKAVLSSSGSPAAGDQVDIERYEEDLRNRARAVGYQERELQNTVFLAEYEHEVISRGRLKDRKDYLLSVWSLSASR